MWRLEASGAFGRGEAPNFQLAGDESAPETGTLPNAVTVRFAATQDGRGFSTARLLRANGYGGTLVAAGPLEPDQARHAFQCGFDAVAIEDATLDRHGREAWEEALRTSVTDLYVRGGGSRLGGPSIWERRHA